MALTQVPNSMLSTGAPSWDASGNLTASANLTLSGTAARITGDFSNATVASRVSIQSSTTNGNTGIYAIPNGTATTAVFRASNNSDPTNASYFGLTAQSAEVRLDSGINGTGTYQPMTFYTNGSEQMRISTAGIVTGTAGNLMLVSGTAQASTSGTSVNFTSVIPTWAKRVTMAFNGVSTNGTNNLIVQLGTGGTATITGYVAQTTGIASSVGATSSSTVGFPSYSNLAAYAWSGIITFQLVSSNIWVGSGVLGNSASTPLTSMISGTVTLAGALDTIRVISSATGSPSDTFDAGSINIQWE